MKWFNFYGLIFIAVIMIPNIIFAMKHKDGFVNKYKNKAVEALEQVGRMPAKNNPNPAKTPIFPRFMPNSPSPVQQVRTRLRQKSSKIATFWLPQDRGSYYSWLA